MANEGKEKNTGTEIIKPKIFNLSSKTLSKYETNILLCGLKFTPTPKRNNIELKSNIQNYTRRLRLAEFFQNKEANDSEENLFQRQSTFTQPRNRDRDLDHQIDAPNNLNLEKMETKSKSILSNMEQKELSKLINDETIVTKPADKGGAVVILSTGHYQSMIMQHLLDENTYKKVDSCIDSKMQSNLLRFLRKYKMCFTEPEWKFLNYKHHEVSNFYALPKIHKSMIIESAITLKTVKSLKFLNQMTLN